MIGHSDLRARGVETAKHRALLGLGVETAQRGRGLGATLLQTTIDWARAHPLLEYVDLSVFAHNAPAIALYERSGFVQTGRVNDLFRVDGTSIDDVQMTLPLR